MKVIKNILKTKEKLKNSFVAIGTFDGVHYGHQQLIKEAVKRAKEQNGTSVVFTFSKHPLELIDKNKAPKAINTAQEKLYILKELGVDYVIMQSFSKTFADLSGEEFVEILKEKVDCSEAFVGFNFSFGVGGKSTPKDLRELGAKKGIVVHETAAIYVDEDIISSTFLRDKIANENIEEINRYLGHYFVIQGEVVHGKKIARELGFPTANIKRAKRVYPKNGIYGARVKIKGEDKVRYGVVNIGVNPTLKPGEKSIEVNILDFDKFIYGKIVTIELVKYLREEKKFSSIEELKKSIGNDVATWKKIISENRYGNSFEN